MASDEKVLGILRPVGGGDPINLTKSQMTIGRRPSNDITLDFENVSSRHCVLRYISGVWHVKDMGSTNGTTINKVRHHSEHTVLPDDLLGIATHVYKIDYEPSAPESVLSGDHVMAYDGEKAERKSLLELAGISPDGAPMQKQKSAPRAESPRPSRAEEPPVDFDDEVPEGFKPAESPGGPDLSDDDFLKFFEGEAK